MPTLGELEQFLSASVHTCMPDQARIRAGLEPVKPKCVFCDEIVHWGQRYRKASATSRARGHALHETCVPGAKSYLKAGYAQNPLMEAQKDLDSIKQLVFQMEHRLAKAVAKAGVKGKRAGAKRLK